MDATCRACGKPAEGAATEDGEATCAACSGRASQRAQRRRLIFDVSTSQTPATARRESAFEGPPSSSPHEETRMLDLRDLVQLSRQSLATLPPPVEHDAPLSVHEAMALVDSLSPPSIVEPAKAHVEASEPTSEVLPVAASTPAEEAASKPARWRWRAAYSGIALLIVMVGMVTAKARMSQDEASETRLAPEQPEPAAPMSSLQELPAEDVSIAEPAPTKAQPSAAAASIATPQKTPVTRPVPARPRAPAPADTGESRAAPAPETTLLDAMAAAVSRHSTPPSAPKGDCPPTPGGGSAPSPCARAAPRTSPPHP